MEDKNKLIYAEYKASSEMHGVMAHLARKYGLSRQRIFSIIKQFEGDASNIEQTRFFNHVLKGDPRECWPYMSKMGEPKSGHARQAWIYTNGEIPDGLVVCHKCDYPPCCNISHLFLGTLSENQKDRGRKGRYRIYDRGQDPRREMFKVHSKRASVLTDNAIDSLVTLMGLLPGMTQAEIIEYALTEYWNMLDKQAEYAPQPHPFIAPDAHLDDVGE